MRRAPVIALLLLAAALAGCGTSSSSGGSFAGEEKQIADQVGELDSAGRAGDAKKICDEVLARALRERLTAAGTTCQTEVDKAVKDADDFDLTVEDVAITGDKATARVRGRGGVRTLGFVREGSDWRASSL
jgi:hypothetical protein